MGNKKSSENSQKPFEVQIGVRLSASIKELLKEVPQDVHPIKKQIYKEALSRLNQQDKEQIMIYIKCNQNTVISQVLYNEIKIQMMDGPYNYKSDFNSQQQPTKSWYVNFSDKNLFGFYHTPLFAQDEVQCCQFPLLPYIKQYIQAYSKQEEGYFPVTRVGMNSYPILVLNCQYLCYVDLLKKNKNYPYGIYGNNFEKLKKEDVNEFFSFPKLEETKNLINLICMSALSIFSQKGQSREYTEAEIVYTFETVYRAFYSAVQESKSNNQNVYVVINTGNWGSGAFGNNLVFTVLVQLAAAHLAKVNCLNYYPFDDQGKYGYQEGYKLFQIFIKQMQQNQVELSLQFQLNFIQFCINQKFTWGSSNGF
ncbi:poly (ADP-ribose) glycohydrolase (macronuclear) [Tetrahymena thermophila SB210]|uniref:Poly (ADP-ribose) glycohydrolase n=1 Tax=Tetrahymena thermophila (strain SB210) TaxID=312017 RepID=Q23R61_TETTS|nr:poly (ADP-ribose) glycohydrolase [Tetrahymena thermophila SB210]EAR98980.1 poly (ADP-ribose) glycohydrolase [Tetrahymena thermophila SB210]|eukprot:XP_001019225.1 poly (ADP-ribose) glycohydrolase [Tetrahymena thermophila SB210]